SLQLAQPPVEPWAGDAELVPVGRERQPALGAWRLLDHEQQHDGAGPGRRRPAAPVPPHGRGRHGAEIGADEADVPAQRLGAAARVPTAEASSRRAFSMPPQQRTYAPASTRATRPPSDRASTASTAVPSAEATRRVAVALSTTRPPAPVRPRCLGSRPRSGCG